jgi:hypothetical protein
MDQYQINADLNIFHRIFQKKYKYDFLTKINEKHTLEHRLFLAGEFTHDVPMLIAMSIHGYTKQDR